MKEVRNVGVIGAGVMGEALITGLIASGIPATSITISEKRVDRAQELIKSYGVNSAEISTTVASSDALLIVVKPQDMALTCQQIQPTLKAETLVISFAAGKKIDFISSHLSGHTPVIRVMPNTPTLVGEGMAAISPGPRTSKQDLDFVRSFLSATGKVVEVPEDLQDAVTATSGSGPAYFFLFVESMIQGGISMGLSQEIATELTIQTLVGSAKLLATSGKSATTLRENVTSPNGTTAAAIASFNAENFAQIVQSAMTAARDRSQELA